MIIGQWYVQGRLHLPKWVCWALLVGGFLVLPLNPRSLPDAVTLWGTTAVGYLLPAAAILVGIVILEQRYALRVHPAAALLGDASYSIYLTHIFTFGLTHSIWLHWAPSVASPMGAVLFAIFSMVSVILLGIATYITVEKPMFMAFQTRYKRYKTRRKLVAVALE